MSTKTVRANSFNGETKAKKEKTPERIAIVAYLLAHPGPHTYNSLEAATGYRTHIVQSRLKSAAEDGEVINVAGHGRPTLWQHRTHHKAATSADVVRRINPITNASMPNGSRSYWARHMAAFNASPRMA